MSMPTTRMGTADDAYCCLCRAEERADVDKRPTGMWGTRVRLSRMERR